MIDFEFVFFYICLIAFLPLIYVTVKTFSWKKLKNKTFRKLLGKDFIRTMPICAFVVLPVLIFPEISKSYLIVLQIIELSSILTTLIIAIVLRKK